MPRAEREAFARAEIQRAAELLRRGDRAGALAVPGTPPEPDGMRDRAPWEAVLAGVMARDDPELTALEQMKAAQDFAMNTRHLLTLAEAFWWKEVAPQIDQAVRERIGEREFARYLADPERPALLQALRDARDRRPPHRGLARRDHRPDARRRPVDRRGAARPPGKRAAPAAGPDGDLG